MSNRAPKDQHAVDRMKERYGISLDERGREEILGAIRKCRWVPLALQGSRLAVLLKYQDQIIDIVFETTDLALVTARPLKEDHLTPEQFERARKFFPELAEYGKSGHPLAEAFPPKEQPASKPPPPAAKPAPAEPKLFDLVLSRFGRDKKKADLWWNTPNYELGGETPAALEARGKAAKVRSFLDRTRVEKGLLRIPQRRETADINCARCHGYPPPDMICGLCEDAG